MISLQDAAQRAYDLTMPHSPVCWRWLITHAGSTELLVERDGVPVPTGRITPPDDEDVVLGEVAAVDQAGAHALLAHVASLTGPDDLTVKERPGCVGGDALDGLLEPAPRLAERYYGLGEQRNSRWR